MITSYRYVFPCGIFGRIELPDIHHFHLRVIDVLEAISKSARIDINELCCSIEGRYHDLTNSTDKIYISCGSTIVCDFRKHKNQIGAGTYIRNPEIPNFEISDDVNVLIWEIRLLSGLSENGTYNFKTRLEGILADFEISPDKEALLSTIELLFRKGTYVEFHGRLASTLLKYQISKRELPDHPMLAGSVIGNCVAAAVEYDYNEPVVNPYHDPLLQSQRFAFYVKISSNVYALREEIILIHKLPMHGFYNFRRRLYRILDKWTDKETMMDTIENLLRSGTSEEFYEQLLPLLLNFQNSQTNCDIIDRDSANFVDRTLKSHDIREAVENRRLDFVLPSHGAKANVLKKLVEETFMDSSDEQFEICRDLFKLYLDSNERGERCRDLLKPFLANIEKKKSVANCAEFSDGDSVAVCAEFGDGDSNINTPEASIELLEEM